ncbi:uncharacterized protein LOC122064814 isoform X2 [Macadamia integrifolia]|uniref:uncharacterized protein LOC122064814 isoform X2 n=1 Tax=Macadamia integrifolia TaxID=60698 RepID=UPI001C501827|nr:uncharacterized protein LOC122064814 isoform X2 [Macadamia integrifolia]
MAEASVKSFLQRLSSLKLQENEASPGLQDQIQKLKNRVEEIGNFPGEVDTSSKQYEGLVCNWESNLIETVHDANNCIDQYVTKTTSRDGSDQALSILQFRSELEKIDARLAGISRPMSQSNMPSWPTSEAKEEIGESSSTNRVDVIGYGENEMLPTLDPFSPPPFMRHLSLCGHLVDIPDWVCSMEGLTKLTLAYSFLPEEAIYVLQFLPNLKHLNLGGACNSKQINKEFCKVGGFPKLETLRICSRDLVEWTEIEKGAFPSLAFLFFQNCLRLMNLPEGLQYVTTLKELMIVALHPDLERRLKPDGGKENYKIKHIPLIRSSRAKLQKLLL